MRHLILGIICFCAANATAADRVVTPAGEYAKIDVTEANRVIRDLLQGSEAARSKAVAAVKANPERYAPPAFYVMSQVLFARDEKDDASFWFYAGQLRARFDANRCLDTTAAQAVSALNQQYGTLINQYAFQDTDRLKQLVERVVAWDRATPHAYDHRWINLHGMGAMMSGLSGTASEKPLSAPEGEWSAIAEQTRKQYIQGLHEALAVRDMKDQRFLVRGDSVTYVSKYGNRVKVPADPATFQPLGGAFGWDKDKVYHVDDVMDGVDRATFSVLGESVARDADSVYYRNQVCKECDPATFRRIAEDVYADSAAVYTDIISWKRLPGVDAASFVVLNNWYSKDALHVYTGDRQLVGADAATFKVGTRGSCESCGEDANRCYWFEKATDCRKGGYSADEFADGITVVPDGAAAIGMPKNPFHHLRPGNSLGKQVWGVQFVRPEGQKLTVTCGALGPVEERKASSIELDLRSGSYWPILVDASQGCGVSIDSKSLIVGQADRPQVQVLMGKEGKQRRLNVEVAPGEQLLRLNCREVTKRGMTDIAVELPVRLEANRIYQLRGTLDPKHRTCSVTAVDLTNSRPIGD